LQLLVFMGCLAEAAQLSWLCGADVLLKLVQERGFEMFVHPIAPVLNETRHVVAPFNYKLQQQVHPPLLNTDCEICQCPVLFLCLCSHHCQPQAECNPCALRTFMKLSRIYHACLRRAKHFELYLATDLECASCRLRF